MTETTPRLSISSVVVEGLEPDASQSAEAEILALLTPFESMDLSIIGDVDLRVVVTHRMEEQVDRVRQEHGIVANPYRRERECGAAASITLTAPGGPPFRITVVLDSGLWALSDGHSVVSRIHMLGYAFGHALRVGQGVGLDWNARATGQRTHTRELRETAATLLDAFDAHCTALDLCQWLRMEDGSPVRCSAFLGNDLIASVHELAEKLCVFAAIDIHSYRMTGVGLEELYPRVGPILGQTLQTLIHVIALYAGDNDYEAALDALEGSPGFSAYLLPEADEIVEALTSTDAERQEAKLVAVLERTLERLGLRIEDMPDGGLYVHVSEPVRCPMIASASPD